LALDVLVIGDVTLVEAVVPVLLLEEVVVPT
jgi:hypothetical protein